MIDLAVSLCTDLVQLAVPVALVFEITNLIVASFLRAAFGGRLWFGR